MPNHLVKIVAVANQKGGVAKTTTAVNLSAALTLKRKKVLLIDADPQANSTSHLGFETKDSANSLYEVLIAELPLEEAISKTRIKNLELVPSRFDLAGAEVELLSIVPRETILKKALNQAKNAYDYIFIDCPPSLNLLTINALAAADSVLIPIQGEYYALEGLSHLMYTIDLLKKSLNPDLEIEGILLTMFDARTRLALDVAKELKSHFGDKVFKTIIPRNIRLSEAPGYGMTIFEYDPHSKGAEAYRALAKEVIKNGS
jgi:chromosome partitioning protein